ncbi:putative oxidoreductase [Catenulispora sp. MAP12-49]
MDADVIIVGAGLAGLTAAHELTSRGRKVALVEQENAANLGGQAWWSFGGCSSSTPPSSGGCG